jgi:hypothetical protein
MLICPSPPNRPATDDLFHTRPLDVREIVVSLVYARCRHTKLSEKQWEKQMYHKTWSVIQIDGDTSLMPKEHQAVNDRKVSHPLDMTLQKFRKIQDVNRNGLSINERCHWVSCSYGVVLLQWNAVQDFAFDGIGRFWFRRWRWDFWFRSVVIEDI